jgi:EAL domain-containing protein (putative c-di-GMP-specific phosphodiesterase class I)
MTDFNQTLLPNIEFSNATVYISTNVHYLFDRITKTLSVLKYPFTFEATYLMVSVPNFELFITEILEGEFFDTLEMKEIHVLPIERDISLDFNLFKRTKTLLYWITFSQNKDLIYILKKQRIVTLFQPIVSVSNLEVIGYEAYSKGLKAGGLYLSAQSLFENAAKLDLLSMLDIQCLESAAQHASELKMHKLLFLNFFPNAILDPKESFKSTTSIVLEQQLNPKNIIFESVHTEHLQDYSHLHDIFDFLKSEGYETALDDVGGHFSTIEPFHKLEPRYVKVDMKITRNIHHEQSHQALLKRILRLKSLYGIKIVAKDVETLEEFNYLKTSGVDFMQGYYFGKPKLTL